MKTAVLWLVMMSVAFASARSLSSAVVTGHVYDQFGLPVSGIKVRDRFQPGLATTTKEDGSYAIQVETNMLASISLAALEDYVCDTTVYGNLAEPTSTKDTSRADIFVVRKPARRGNIKLTVPWIMSHGAKHNITHSNLVVEVRPKEDYYRASTFMGASEDHIVLTNITYGVEYYLGLTVSSLENAQMSLINGVFMEGDVGTTNQFRLLPACSKQYGVTNVVFSIESKQ